MKPTRTDNDLLRCLEDCSEEQPDAAHVTTLALAAASGRLKRMTAQAHWALLAAALMAPRPSGALETLRQARALPQLLPELDALFGVPQLCEGPRWVDVGEHQWRFIDEAARAEAPLALRFAALMHKTGKSGTPPDIWPHHHGHEQRAHAAIDALAQRAAVPAEALAMAHLAVDECDRVHRMSDMRAGAIAQLLERVQAREHPVRLDQLLLLCGCDWAAFEGHQHEQYPRAVRLRLALEASRAAEVTGLGEEAALQARAEAIAAALGSRARG
ncbi:tRNA nucleotidyltransferase [Azohydromonas caseinilytica]|uniref:tRNA nucleotidyltransferase n=1 Tax=Azohydromonas caseinilytica TaxID=2728836 RepID=A0A848FE00_9BURK|nr:tRNA nucleotidyltransferase [Azohydromonas caseinilytica]NML16121.1 tRNA nucleotidyltransferase [Azohydromonas caseinilytica]